MYLHKFIAVISSLIQSLLPPVEHRSQLIAGDPAGLPHPAGADHGPEQPRPRASAQDAAGLAGADRRDVLLGRSAQGPGAASLSASHFLRRPRCALRPGRPGSADRTGSLPPLTFTAGSLF